MNAIPLQDKYYLLRLPLALAAGGVLALALTWGMHALIQSSEARLDESERIHLLDFVRLNREETPQRNERKPDRPADEPPPPAPPENTADANQDSSGSTMALAAPATDLDTSINGLAIGTDEGEYLPIIKVAPSYPQQASIKRLEGECTVTYTVTTNGSTKDVEVLENGCDYSVFERPSIRAAEKFKYRPRVINGEAVEVHGVKNRFVFTLEK